MSAVKKLDLQPHDTVTSNDIEPLLQLVSPISQIGLHASIGVTQALEPVDVIRLARGSSYRHLVQKGNIAFDAELEAAKRMCNDPKHFLENAASAAFGFSRTERPALSYVCSADEKKTKAMERLETYVGGLSMSPGVRESVMTAADELYTNCAKNAAPLGHDAIEMGIPTRPGRIEILAHSDGERMLLGCVDSFGDLVVRRVLDRIRNCYENGVSQSINQGEGGAGIGSFMVFQNAIGYYLGVDAGVRTVVCVAFPLGMSLKRAAVLPKNIHIVLQKPENAPAKAEGK